MNANETMPEAVRITLQTLDRLITSEEQRRQQLLAEIHVLRLRQRVIAASQNASWLTERFLEPRLAELEEVERRLAIAMERRDEVRVRWRPEPEEVSVPRFEMEAGGILCLTA